MLVGINTDPRHWPNFSRHAADLKAAGAEIARFPLAANSGVDYNGFCNALSAAGVEPLPVYAGESMAVLFQDWQQQLGPTVRKWQIGNEADSKDPSSSWVMNQAQFSQLLAHGRAELGPSVMLIAGGLVSGQPGWLDSVDLSPVDAIAVHPYGQRPSPDFPTPTWGFGNAADLINAYKRFGKPIWVTEYGAVLKGFTDGQQRGDYYGKMPTALAHAGCEGVLCFCWGDKMVPGFGLRDGADNPTPAYDAFRIAALALQQLNQGGGGSGNMTIEQMVAMTRNADGTPRKTGLYQPIKEVVPGFRIAYSNVPNEIIFEIDGVAQAINGKDNPLP